jgi:DNA-binding MarR family transcriptional regulator
VVGALGRSVVQADTQARRRVANLFGAAALAAVGAVAEAMAGIREGGLSAAAALVTLASQPGLGVTELGRHIGLSQSATVRMIDSLSEQGLVERTPGANRRTVALRLTTEGQDRARRVLAGRERALARLLEPLGDEMLPAFGTALAAVLDALTVGGAPVNQTCRLCDERACTAAAPCPVDLAWRRGSGQC